MVFPGLNLSVYLNNRHEAYSSKSGEIAQAHPESVGDMNWTNLVQYIIIASPA
jgi:hypothetical protein